MWIASFFGRGLHCLEPRLILAGDPLRASMQLLVQSSQLGSQVLLVALLPGAGGRGLVQPATQFLNARRMRYPIAIETA